jgi:glycosyltransferase involved in cell wall biosynthesis
LDRVDALVLLIPVLKRPQNVAPLLESIAEATPQPYRVLFIADSHDKAEHTAVRKAGGQLLLCDGNYAKKINLGVKATEEPLIFLGADDLRFHAGWLEAATRKIKGTIGVVGTNDLGNPRVVKGLHATHSLITRDYAERGTIDDPSRVLHEAYPHEFVDDEFIQTAKKRRAFAHASTSVVEHLHPLWNKGEWDEVYSPHKKRMAIGRRIYNKRRPLWM